MYQKLLKLFTLCILSLCLMVSFAACASKESPYHPDETLDSSYENTGDHLIQDIENTGDHLIQDIEDAGDTLMEDAKDLLEGDKNQ